MYGRVLKIGRREDEDYGAYISVLLSTAQYEVHAERAIIHSISCQGRVISGRGKPYDQADATIEFIEHTCNWYDELPNAAFFGDFDYYPRRPDEKYSTVHFAFFLRYVPQDARRFLVPLLSQEIENQVILDINLVNEEDELISVTDNIRGHVRHYSFKVRTRMVKDGVEL